VQNQTNNLSQMNTKHTPGPWKQYRDSQGNVRIQGNVPGGPVAFIEEMNNTGGTPQDHANARLIAAAPELLDALKRILEGNTMEGREEWGFRDVIQEHYKIARAAIAKATNPSADL
jgi:hypothetical protein